MTLVHLAQVWQLCPIITLLKSGDHILVSYNVYGGTFRIIDKIYRNFKIEVDWINTSDLQTVKME